MPVLGTKLHLPSPRRRLVQRARLTGQLRVDGREGPRLVLVAAPAGFGKTTLLAQWLAAEKPRRKVAWLALDPGDADVRLFLAHLVAAVQTAEPEAGVEALALLEAGSTTPADAVLVSLINDLDVFAGPMVVALDDYHVIDGAAVHEAVTFLLDNLPPQVTLAVATRADPPLPLSRLRARGELVEVRAADLRFTTGEAGVFLNEVMGLRLEPALVAALEARTEGWAAGLQLHAAASRWLAENGLLADAVRHAIASGEHEHTADLIELAVADLRRRRQNRTLRDWLAALPDDVLRRRALLATCVGDCRLSEGDFEGVEAWLDAAEAGLGTTPPLAIPTGGRWPRRPGTGRARSAPSRP